MAGVRRFTGPDDRDLIIVWSEMNINFYVFVNVTVLLIFTDNVKRIFNMTCKEFSGMIPAFLEESLDDIFLREFLHHYDSCRGCREEVEIQYLIDRAFDGEKISEGINLAKDLPAFIEKERRSVAVRSGLSNAASSLELIAVITAIVTAILYLSQ